MKKNPAKPKSRRPRMKTCLLCDGRAKDETGLCRQHGRALRITEAWIRGDIVLELPHADCEYVELGK